MNFYVYILYSASLDRYYVGMTGNLSDRLQRHNQGRSRYAKPGIPWELVHTELFETRSAALNREQEIKGKKSRIYIESLIPN